MAVIRSNSLTRLAMTNVLFCLALSCTNKQLGLYSVSDGLFGMRYDGLLNEGVWENGRIS